MKVAKTLISFLLLPAVLTVSSHMVYAESDVEPIETVTHRAETFSDINKVCVLDVDGEPIVFYGADVRQVDQKTIMISYEDSEKILNSTDKTDLDFTSRVLVDECEEKPE